MKRFLIALGWGCFTLVACLWLPGCNTMAYTCRGIGLDLADMSQSYVERSEQSRTNTGSQQYAENNATQGNNNFRQ